MQNENCDRSFNYNGFQGGIRYCRNDKGKWYVAQKIPLMTMGLRGYNKYMILTKGISDEFNNKDEAIKQIEGYLKEIIDNGKIYNFRIDGKRKKA